MTPHMRCAREIVANLAAVGVTTFVVCPGSRSGPLALALTEAAAPSRPEGAPAIDLHVRIDERSAAFMALGIARQSRSPVAVVTTSGTAVGNLLPAFMEAAHSGIPLLAITADRPAHVRGVGANQTTDQRRILHPFTSLNLDVGPPTTVQGASRLAATVRSRVEDWRQASPFAHARPGHLNIQFEEPLLPDNASWPQAREHEVSSDVTQELVAYTPPAVTRGVVIAGDEASSLAKDLAEAYHWPLLAEPSSGARTGIATVERYQELLTTPHGQELASQVECVVVIGRPTLTRPIRALIESAPRLVVHNYGPEFSGTPLHAEHSSTSLTHRLEYETVESDTSWREEWCSAGAAIPVSSHWSMETIVVASATAATGGILVLGSSGIIRAADRALPSGSSQSGPAQVIANRGLSGIDGTVSTAIGVALTSTGPVVAAMGDLTFLHDASGMWIGTREHTPDLTIVVANDGGGRIFGTLEHATAPVEHFERVFTTPHAVTCEALARAYGASYTLADTEPALREALHDPPAGLRVVEARLPGAG